MGILPAGKALSFVPLRDTVLRISEGTAWVTLGLGLAEVPTDNTPVEGGTVTVQEAGGTDPTEPTEPVGETYTLTNGTDVVTANVFNSGLVYVPGGNDRINALQDEDVLTGIAGRTDNTLNVTLGNPNDNGGWTITPYLNNIQNINIDWTGESTTLDLRNAIITEDVVINSTCIFAGIDIFVPQNVQVKVAGVPVFGGVDNKAANAAPGAPTVYVNSTCIFSGVDIK